jgi:O-antigen/teichoic acid export membrane protein
MAARVGADPSQPQVGPLRERLLTLGKQTFVYGLAGASSQAVGLFTLPIFARAFTTAQYGVVEVAIVGYAALLVFADTGLTSGAQRSYYDYDDHQTRERRAALFTGLSASMALAAVLAGGLVAFAEPISRWIFNTTEYALVVRLIGLTLPVGTLVAFSLEAMRLRFKPWRYTACALISALGAAVVGVVSVVSFDVGVEGVVLGTLVGTALAALYGLAVARRYLLGRFSRPELRKMVAYGLPLLPAAVALWGLNFVDRVMLAKLGSLADTGEYAVANRFAFVLMFAVTAFATAFGPFQLALWKEDTELEKRVRDHTLTYLTVALVSVGVVLAVFAREIVAVVAPSFDEAYRVVGLLLMAIVLWGIANLVLFGIGLMRRTGYVALFTLLAAGGNIALNVVLIPAWGIIGAAIANLAAYALLVALYYRKSQQLYPTDYTLRKPAIVLTAGAAAMAVGALPLESSLLTMGVKALTVTAFVGALRLLRVIDEPEVAELRGLARRLLSFGRPAT